MAKQKGASQGQIEGVNDFEAGPYTAREKAGFRFADRLHRSVHEVDDSFFAELKGLFSTAEIVELTVTAAAFEMFTRVVDALNLPVTPGAAPESKK